MKKQAKKIDKKNTNQQNGQTNKLVSLLSYMLWSLDVVSFTCFTQDFSMMGVNPLDI